MKSIFDKMLLSIYPFLQRAKARNEEFKKDNRGAEILEYAIIIIVVVALIVIVWKFRDTIASWLEDAYNSLVGAKDGASSSTTPTTAP